MRARRNRHRTTQTVAPRWAAGVRPLSANGEIASVPIFRAAGSPQHLLDHKNSTYTPPELP